MKIAFLLSVVSEARYYRRVTALQEIGAEAQILAFERDYYEGKPWPMGYQSLGRISHGRYYRRLAALARALPLVRTELKGADAVYVFGLDTLLLALIATWSLARKIPIVYEVGDLGVRTKHNRTARIVRWLEFRALRRVSLLVLTSEGYLTAYFEPSVRKLDLNYQIIENKVDPKTFPKEPATDAHSKARRGRAQLRIGYFGLIRDRYSCEVLKEIARRGDGQVQIYMRGIFLGLDDLEEEIKRSDHIVYEGPYVSPDDLPELYGCVDVVWVAYRNLNHDIMRRLRFYEACYYQRPMIGQRDTLDGKSIKEYGLGVCIDLLDVESSVAAVMNIGEDDLIRWENNLNRLPSQVYEYTGEHQQLFDFLKQRTT